MYCTYGADDASALRESRDQLRELMSRGAFYLRKWTANSLDLLDDIPTKEHKLAVERSLNNDES